MFCKEQVAQLVEKVDEIHARGAELVVVGNGAPFFAKAFAEERHLTTPVFTDPELRAFEAAQLRRSARASVGLRVARHAVRAMKGGFFQTSVEGDGQQQGGLFVITPAGRVLFSHVSEVAGDHPDVDDVLAALPQR